MSHPQRFAPPVVLVVEDESFVRMVAVDSLEDAGFTVVEAGNADEAWSILCRRTDISVLFTDINMPGSMDGLILATRVAECWPNIHLVITSGRRGLSSDEIPDHGSFVQKPYHQFELMNAIGQAG